MTEEETKEDTILKLANLTWQRKLNERNSLPKCLNSDSEQYWNPSKPNSESRFNEIKQRVQIHQTQVFKSKNDLAASKQSKDNQRENENFSYQKKYVTVKESSNDQRYEQLPKNRSDYNGQNYRKDEKENVNVQKNLVRTNFSNQSYSQNQKYFKRDDNQNFRRNGSYGNESTNRNQNDENIVQNQRNFTYQSRNYNQNNRGYQRYQDKSSYQNNYQRNDAKNRNNYQNSRNQQFYQNDNKTELPTRKNESFKKNSGNSFTQSSNYLKLGTSPENSTSGIHYQRTFSPKTINKSCSSNFMNNQIANSIVCENFIHDPELFAELDLSSENCGSNVENVYSSDNSFLPSQFTNFGNANNFSNESFSNQFTAGISEPIITNIHQNDTYRNNVQLNQQSSIPDETVNFVDNYTPSNQSMMTNNYTDSSYSNQITSSTPVRNTQCQFMDQFASNNIPVTFSSLSPDVADFVPRKNKVQNSNQMEFSNPLIDLHQERNIENSGPFLFSTPNSGQSLNTSLLSQNDISSCNESTFLGNSAFQNCISASAIFNHRNSTEEPHDIFNRRDIIVPVNRYNSNDRLNDILNQQFPVPVNHRNSNEVLNDVFSSQSEISTNYCNSNEELNDFLGQRITIPANQRNSSEELSNIFGQQIAIPPNQCNSNERMNIFNQQISDPIVQCNSNGLDIFNQQSAVPDNRCDSNEILNDTFNRQPTQVPDTSTGQTFNFNGRMVNLCDKKNQIDATQHPLSHDNIQNFCRYQDDLIGNELNRGIGMNSDSGTNHYSENLSLNNQQLTNIYKIASLNLNQDTPVSTNNQQNNDMLLMSNLNANLNQSIIRQTNASILSQNVANNSSNRSVCNVMQNSRVNIMQDYYKKPAADVANNLKCNESVEMNSQFEIVAQQLINVNNYVTSAEINGGTITTKNSVCDTSPGQFNMATYKRCKNEMEKYRQAGNFANDNSLLSNYSKNQYENILFTPTSIESSKPYDTFSSQTFANSNFNRNKEQQVDIGTRYNDGTINNNRVVTTEFATNVNPSRAKTTNDFQNNYGRNNVPNNSNARYRYANATLEKNTSPKNNQTSLKNDFNRSNNNRRMFNNQLRIVSDESSNSMTNNIRDDSFIKFTRKARPEDNLKFTIAEPPSVGILKKTQPKPLIPDTSVQFQKSPKDQKPEDMFVSSKEAQTLNKRVSFLLESDQQ